jgi:hypothetical protein
LPGSPPFAFGLMVWCLFGTAERFMDSRLGVSAGRAGRHR